MQALKALVIGMGILILLGLAVIIATIVSRVTGGAEETYGTVHLGMSASCRVAEATPADGGIVLRFDGPDKDGCGRLIVLDPREGTILGRIAPGEPPMTPLAGSKPE